MSSPQSEKETNEDDDYDSESQGSTNSESQLTDFSSEKSRSEEEIRLRRSRRSAISPKKTKPLPFSPRKTRSKTKTAAVSADSGDDSTGVDSDLEVLPLRRSMRSKNVRPNLADSSAYEDAEIDEEDGSETDSYSIARKPKIVKKKPAPKISRPAYGFFRPVSNLDYDEDPKTAVLRAHRDVCDKCHQKPTHILLANFKRGGKRRKRASSDSDGDEESKLIKKGGWVRWYVQCYLQNSCATAQIFMQS
jgi:chromodomain-helicase-DNA-binding protein 4